MDLQVPGKVKLGHNRHEASAYFSQDTCCLESLRTQLLGCEKSKPHIRCSVDSLKSKLWVILAPELSIWENLSTGDPAPYLFEPSINQDSPRYLILPCWDPRDHKQTNLFLLCLLQILTFRIHGYNKTFAFYDSNRFFFYAIKGRWLRNNR